MWVGRFTKFTTKCHRMKPRVIHNYYKYVSIADLIKQPSVSGKKASLFHHKRMAWNFTNASATGRNEYNIYSGITFYSSTVSSLVIVILNSFAAFILKRSNKLPYQIAIIAMNLCICDLVTGLLLWIPSVWFYQIFGCYLKKYIFMTVSYTSFLTITLINLNLCSANLFTFYYERLVTPRNIRVCCVSSWILGFIFAYMFYYTGDPPTAGITCTKYKTGQENGVSSYIAFGVLILDYAMYGYLSHVIKKSRRVSPQTNELQSNPTFRKNCSKLSVLTTTFFVLQSPMVIYFALLPICKFPRNQQVEICFLAIHLLNCIVNPFLYVVRFQECKYQLKLLITACNKKRNEEIHAERRQYFATYTIENRVRIIHM